MSPVYTLERYKPGLHPEHLATGDIVSVTAALAAHGSSDPPGNRISRLGRREQAVFRAPDGFTLHVERDI